MELITHGMPLLFQILRASKVLMDRDFTGGARVKDGDEVKGVCSRVCVPRALPRRVSGFIVDHFGGGGRCLVNHREWNKNNNQ